MSIFNSNRYMPSSPEIRKLRDEIKEIKLRKYQKKLEQEKKKLLDEENGTKGDDLATVDEREAEKKDIYKYMLGAILSYTLLMLFMLSTFFIIHKLRQYGCNLVEDGFAKLKKQLEASGGDSIGVTGYDDNMTDAEKRQFIHALVQVTQDECQYFLKQSFNKNSAIVTLHNLTFGLVSAVVVSQIGSHQQQQQSQQKNRSTSGSSIVSRLVYNFITWTPQIYVLTWIFAGCSCLICGSIWGSEYSGPLYVTGQAWLGIAITTVYLFFGLQGTAKEKNETKKEKDNIVDEHNDDDNDDNDDDSGDDSINADCSKHNDKDEELAGDLTIGNSSSVSGKNNIVTSSAIIQTATSRSKLVEEKGDNDEEEGTLYLMGTTSNDKRNDDDADDFPQV